jgi:hypothetical protein
MLRRLHYRPCVALATAAFVFVPHAASAEPLRFEPAATTRESSEVKAPDEPVQVVPIDVGIWPRASINALYAGPVRNAVSLSLAWADPHEVEGFQLSLGGAAAQQRIRGVQLGGMVAAAGEEATGMQLAGLVAASGEGSLGLQAGGLVAGTGEDVAGGQLGGLVAGAGGRARGIQAGGLVAGSGEDLAGIQVGGLVAGSGSGGWGLQAGGVVAGAGGDFVGLQGGGVIAGAGGQLVGLQVGGLLAGAEGAKGLQISGGLAGAESLTGGQIGAVAGAAEARGVQLAIVNLSEHVRGVQLGIVNLARRVDGAQVGIVNVAKQVRGASIAPVGYVDEAPRYAEVWASELAILSAGARLGTRRVTTLVELGFDPLRADSRLVAGAGLGLRFWLAEWVTLEPELWGRGVILAWDTGRVASVQTARLRASFELREDLSVFGGAALNGSTDADAADLIDGPSWRAGDELEFWPGAFAGVSLRI